jgi:hypothetical protein
VFWKPSSLDLVGKIIDYFLDNKLKVNDKHFEVVGACAANVNE